MEIFLLAFFGIAVYLIFIFFTKKGRGVILGGKVIETLDNEIKQRSGIRNTTIRVHVIEKKREIEKSVVIELNQHMYLSWSVMPINLTKAEARQLVSMIEQAIQA